MNTLEFLAKRYKVDVTQKFIDLPIGRWQGLCCLLRDLKFNKGVEMGVYRGHYSEALMKVNPDLDLTGIDSWKVYKGYKDYMRVDLEQGVYEEAKERAKKRGFKLIKGFSMDVVKQFENESLDFVYIDGNHEFRHVVDDVDEWSKKVRSGGIVAGHDFYQNFHQRFGVREAIPAWCEANQIKPLFALTEEHCPSWMYVKP
jgi:hypothetical protein